MSLDIPTVVVLHGNNRESYAKAIPKVGIDMPLLVLGLTDKYTEQNPHNQSYIADIGRVAHLLIADDCLETPDGMAAQAHAQAADVPITLFNEDYEISGGIIS